MNKDYERGVRDGAIICGMAWFVASVMMILGFSFLGGGM